MDTATEILKNILLPICSYLQDVQNKCPEEINQIELNMAVIFSGGPDGRGISEDWEIPTSAFSLRQLKMMQETLGPVLGSLGSLSRLLSQIEWDFGNRKIVVKALKDSSFKPLLESYIPALSEKKR